MVSHEIYPIPEDEEERGSHNQQHAPGQQRNTQPRERTSRSEREPNPPPNGDQGTRGSAGAPGGGGAGDEPSNSSGDEGPNQDEDANSEEENESSVTSARMRGQRGTPAPKPKDPIDPIKDKDVLHCRINPEEIIERQVKDQLCQNIQNRITKEGPKAVYPYYMEGELLMRYVEDKKQWFGSNCYTKEFVHSCA